MLNPMALVCVRVNGRINGRGYATAKETSAGDDVVVACNAFARRRKCRFTPLLGDDDEVTICTFLPSLLGLL